MKNKIQNITAKIETLKANLSRHHAPQLDWPQSQITSPKVMEIILLGKDLQIVKLKNRSHQLANDMAENFVRREHVKLATLLGFLAILLGFIFAGIFTAQGLFGDYAFWTGFALGPITMGIVVGATHIAVDEWQIRKADKAAAEQRAKDAEGDELPPPPAEINIVC